MKFSVIIPCWNEGMTLVSHLKRLREISKGSRMEVILVDGGSTDNTVTAGRLWADWMVTLDKPSRGAQLHAGAQKATGDILFFLHADTQLPNDWQECLEKIWINPRSKNLSATVFSVDYGSGRGMRFIAWAQNMRTRFWQVACGDQGIATTAAIYDKSGGFPPIPIMEDLEFSRRLRRLGRLEILPERIMSAASRLYSRGPLWNALLNRWMGLRYALGARPETLWKSYYAKSRHDEKPRVWPFKQNTDYH